MKYIYYFLLVLWFIPASAQKSETAKYLESIGLVNIAKADSSIVIDLMYTRADNFTGKVLYEDLHEAYLRPKRTIASTTRAEETSPCVSPHCI